MASEPTEWSGFLDYPEQPEAPPDATRRVFAEPLAQAVESALPGAQGAPGRRPEAVAGRRAPRRSAPTVGQAAALTGPSGWSAAAQMAGLTPREWQVLTLLAGGASTRTIASQLCISPHTAVRHAASILGKLGAATRGEAVAKALGVAPHCPETRAAAPRPVSRRALARSRTRSVHSGRG
jgi:DNA-binding NarL/FixJ family response regulator